MSGDDDKPRVDEVSPTPLDRGATPVAGDYGASRYGRAAAIVVLAAVCGLLILAPWKRRPEAEAAKPPAPRQTVAFEPAREGLAPQTMELFDGEEASELQSTEPDPVGAAPAEATTSAPVPRPPSVLAWSASSRAVERVPEGRSARADGVAGDVRDAIDDPYARLRRSEEIETARARRIGDRNLLLTAGAAIPCTLQTAMDSSLPGQVSCIVGRDVWSEAGTVALLEKGSKVLGEYRRGLNTGEGRLFVMWTRVVTPGGVAVDLASPGADALGRAGFGGDIERHFWRRFGGAVLLSIVDAAPAAALDDGSGRGMARLPSQAAAIAVDRSIDIAPTLRKAQGSLVSIMVAKDLDFSSVYAVSDGHRRGAP
ncbi:type IV secretion system protein VirB10 [Caulobacter sp. 73W]|uniref:Type IV secretion system protein VirB10 n=1 Tax=Caulobacter sp. 73W TaxID=3161137 RepID=A0AB39KRN1_9CAUL